MHKNSAGEESVFFNLNFSNADLFDILFEN